MPLQGSENDNVSLPGGVSPSIMGLLTFLGVSSMLLIIAWSTSQRRKKLGKGVIFPPHLKSYIPYFGLAMRLVNGLTRNFIIETARQLDSSVFTATIAGTKCVFIADPDLVFIVFKDSVQEIDSLSLQKKAMSSISGIDPLAAETMLEDKEQYKVVMGQIHKYLIHSENLVKNIEEVQHVIDETLNDMTSNVLVGDGDDGWSSLPMFAFVRKAIFFASIGPLVSKGLMSDNVLTDYTKFEDGLALLFSDAPSFVTRGNVAARERLIEFLMKSEVSDRFSDFMKAREKVLGEDSENFARMNLMMFIATVSNSIPSVFWVLFHILTDKVALQACLEEVQNVEGMRQGKYFTLEELDKMPILDSCFKESLRLYQSFFATRNVTNDFILNPKGNPKFLIEKGSRIMAYPNTVHMDPNIWGENVETFQYDRFIDPTQKAKNGKLLINQLRPFGGGAHLCPGRKFIGYESRAFLAMMLLRLDMKLIETTKPDIQLLRQGFSVAHPSFDPIFHVRPRQQKV